MDPVPSYADSDNGERHENVGAIVTKRCGYRRTTMSVVPSLQREVVSWDLCPLHLLTLILPYRLVCIYSGNCPLVRPSIGSSHASQVGHRSKSGWSSHAVCKIRLVYSAVLGTSYSML
jgi:hypothetical protein